MPNANGLRPCARRDVGDTALAERREAVEIGGDGGVFETAEVAERLAEEE